MSAPRGFDDLIEGNRRFAAGYRPLESGAPAKRLAVITCIDARLDPLAILGLSPGDAKIIRNAGARVTDDALRSVIIATQVLGVDRIAVVQHTDCKMNSDPRTVERLVGERSGRDTSRWASLAFEDQRDALAADLQRLRTCELLPPGVETAGFVCDVSTGLLEPLEPVL